MDRKYFHTKISNVYSKIRGFQNVDEIHKTIEDYLGSKLSDLDKLAVLM